MMRCAVSVASRESTRLRSRVSRPNLFLSSRYIISQIFRGVAGHVVPWELRVPFQEPSLSEREKRGGKIYGPWGRTRWENRLCRKGTKRQRTAAPYLPVQDSTVLQNCIVQYIVLQYYSHIVSGVTRRRYRGTSRRALTLGASQPHHDLPRAHHTPTRNWATPHPQPSPAIMTSQASSPSLGEAINPRRTYSGLARFVPVTRTREKGIA